MKFIGCTVALITAIILTQARGTWVALAIGLAFVLLLAPIKLKFRLIIIILTISTTIIVVPLFRNAITSRIHEYEGQDYSSWNIRLKSIPVALDIIKDKPFFGGGPFNAIRYKDKYASDMPLRKTSFENSYLGWLIDLGLVGCSLLYCIFFIVLYRVLYSIMQKPNTNHTLYFVTWSLITMFLNIATFNFDSYRISSFVLWFFMGTAVSLSHFTTPYPIQKDRK